MTKIATQFLLSAGIVAAVTVPEVIPGPGLPSLESLNLTSQDLHAMGPIEIPADHGTDHSVTSRVKRHGNPKPPACFYDSADLVNRGAVLSCVNFLFALGTHPCTVSKGASFAQWCNVGNVALYGNNVKAKPSVSSYCRDVAISAQWVYNNCNYDNTNQWGGWDYANGNGDILVSIVPK